MNSVQILMLSLMVLIVLISGVLCIQTLKKHKTIEIKPILQQTCFILTIGSLFNLSAAFSKVVSAKPNMYIYILWIVTLILLLFCIYDYTKSRGHIFKIKEFVLEYKCIVVVLLISTITRLILFHDITVQRWDGGQYYYALGTGCQNYDFTLGSVWAHFRLANHSTLGVSLIMGIGEFLNPRGVKGVLYVNLFLTIVAFYCIYEMLRKYWAKYNDRQAAVGVLLISVSPLILGTCGYFNVDYVMAMVLVFMIYCEYREWNLLLCFWGIVLVQTKETGVFVFAGYFVGHFLYWMINKKGSFVQRFFGVFNEKITWATMGVAFSYAFYLYKLGALTAWSQFEGKGSQVFWSNSGNNCFGFQPQNIYVKCLQFFVLNFAWIMMSVFLVLIIHTFIKRQKIQLHLKNMQGVLGGLGAFILFSFIYITWDLERYNVPFVTLYVLVLYILCENLFVQKGYRKMQLVTWAIISFLFIIQTFRPADFLSNKVFKTLNTGTAHMLFTSKSSDYYGDALINNYQYNWLEHGLNLVFQEVNYNPEVCFYFHGNHQMLGAHISGNGVAYSVFWDKKEERRVMYENENTYQINLLEELDENSPKHVVAIFIPYYEFDEEEILNKYTELYQIGERQIVKNYGGEIYFYHMLKR